MLELLWLLLPVAAASGWLAARRSVRSSDTSTGDRTPAYFRGLNYLLNEQPDKAIDVFVKMLEVDSETVETHLALGNLFRRRGEVDRAIRIHQNLIARPTLNRDQRAQALLELGQDYMRAGLFDRAESLFRELSEMKLYQERALENLRVIYQQEKEWQECLEVAKKLEQLTGHSLCRERAHYYCELAEEARARNELSQAAALLKKARGCDEGCVRASILQGNLEVAKGACRDAIRSYQRVEQQDPAFLSEVLPMLLSCYRQSAGRTELRRYLEQLFQRHPAIAPALALADLIQADDGDREAVQFLTDYLQEHPDLEGLERLIRLKLEDGDVAAGDTLEVLHRLVSRLLEGRPAYQCGQCGFTAKTLHWQCPGCKTWNSIKPVHGLFAGRS